MAGDDYEATKSACDQPQRLGDAVNTVSRQHETFNYAHAPTIAINNAPATTLAHACSLRFPCKVT